MSDAPAPLVLVVDDEAPILRVVSAALEARGYRVATAENAETAIHLSATDTPAVIILDLGLPDMDGIEVCHRIRQWSETPIIVLTAEGADDRKVSALDEGADDYVTKPFSMPELLARVRVALRHHRYPPGETSQSEIEVGDLTVDLAGHEVRLAGRVVDVTPKEFDFLALLARHPGRVLTHRTILQEVWGPEYGTESQYLRVYASQLRKKLADDPARPRLVTEPGVGYRLVDPAETRASGA
jgi:two-component system, OmpR family, KDP operon response regulator KdpE